MKEEEGVFVFNLEAIINFVLDCDEEKNNDSEITEIYVVDEETKNVSLTTKQLRELKNNDLTPQQTIRYDIIKKFLDTLIDIDDENLTFGETIVINTMMTQGLINTIKEGDI